MRRSQGNGRAPPPPGDVRGEEKEEKAGATNGRAGAKKERWSTMYVNLVLIALLVEKEPDGGKGQMARSYLQSSKVLRKERREFRSLRALELVGVLRIGNGSFCRLPSFFPVIGFRRMRSLLSQPSHFATSTCSSLFSCKFV